MLTKSQIEEFNENGYLLVPGVLTPQQVQALRVSLTSKFDVSESARLPCDTDQYLFDLFNRHPDLRWLLFHEALVTALRSLLGEDFVVLRESSAHSQVYGGWHKDTSAQERAGHQFHWTEDYLMVEAVFYLQDNNPEFGGGLDVQPKSHRAGDEFVQLRERGLLSRAFRKITGKDEEARRHVLSIASKAGDLVIFHFRINHRATQPRSSFIPAEHRKLAVFIACSRNDRHVQSYHDFIATRSGYEYLRDFNYTKELLEESATHGIKLA
jgi:hypothetical protein